MKRLPLAVSAVALSLAGPLAAQPAPRPAPPGLIQSDAYRTAYVRLGLRNAEGLLYEPALPDRRAHIALLYIHPNGNTFTEPAAAQLASRGFPILMVNYHGSGTDGDQAFAPAISQGLRYLRSRPGVEKVVIVGHSGGGHLTVFYVNTALNGPAGCSGPEKIVGCDAKLTDGLEKPDGLVLLDPTLGTFHQANSLDPATGARGRIASLDMFAPANGFDKAARRARYAPAFVARFNAAQAARSMQLTATAQTRLKLIEAGKGRFRDDEPMVVPGMGNLSSGARLHQPDPSLLAHTRGSYVTLKADGSTAIGPIHSVRPPMGSETADGLGTLEQMTRNTSVRGYLASSAIRFRPDFAITIDNIRGVDWRSGLESTPGNAEGVTVPTLMLTMSCHYLVVPDEIIFEHLGSRDKTLMAVEGATHLFTPCRPDYGDTMARTFDAVAAWLGKEGRF